MSEETKGLAKKSSLTGQIAAAVWIAGWSAVKFITNLDTFEIKDVCLSGAFIAACFSPVYFSIILDKIKDIKLGGG